VVGITLSLLHGCRMAEPVIKTEQSAECVCFTTIVCCFVGRTTFLLGSASADAQNANAIAKLAHRIDQPQKPRGFITVVI